MTSDAAIDDLELLRRSVDEKDREAFATLYDRHAPTLFGLALRILRNRAESEDLLQEVFLYVWSHGHAFDSRRGSLVYWLCLVTRSRAIDRLRQRQRVEGMEARHRVDHTGASIEEALLKDGLPLPLDQLTTQESSARLRQSLQELPDAQRKVVELAYFDGFTQEEIAHALSEPLGTVKTRARLALLKLADALSPELQEP